MRQPSTRRFRVEGAGLRTRVVHCRVQGEAFRYLEAALLLEPAAALAALRLEVAHLAAHVAHLLEVVALGLEVVAAARVAPAVHAAAAAALLLEAAAALEPALLLESARGAALGLEVAHLAADVAHLVKVVALGLQVVPAARVAPAVHAAAAAATEPTLLLEAAAALLLEAAAAAAAAALSEPALVLHVPDLPAEVTDVAQVGAFCLDVPSIAARVARRIHRAARSHVACTKEATRTQWDLGHSAKRSPAILCGDFARAACW